MLKVSDLGQPDSSESVSLSHLVSDSKGVCISMDPSSTDKKKKKKEKETKKEKKTRTKREKPEQEDEDGGGSPQVCPQLQAVCECSHRTNRSITAPSCESQEGDGSVPNVPRAI
jgi:hypothetical protein